jgi:hypothetical protein
MPLHYSSNNRLESHTSSINSFSNTLKKTAINIAVGSAIIVGGIWVLFNVPGVLPFGISPEKAVASAG